MKKRIESFRYFRGYTNEPIGRRGRTFIEPCYVFAPYIPLMRQPEPAFMGTLITNEIRTRYATRIVNNSFYGTIQVNGD